jgi:hypothetical protein
MQFSATFVILNKRLPRQIAIRGDRNDVRASFFPTGESREENSRGFNYLSFFKKQRICHRAYFAQSEQIKSYLSISPMDLPQNPAQVNFFSLA